MPHQTDSPLSEINLQREHRKLVFATIWKTLLVPLAILAFLLFAPHWWNLQVRNSIISEVNAIPELTQQEKNARIEAVKVMDFQKLSKTYPPYLEDLHKGLVNSGVAARFNHLRWGLTLAAAHITALLSGIMILALLGRNARQSIATLIRNYHLGWNLAVALAILNMLLLVPLVAYTLFEITTMAAGVILTGVLFTLLIGGALAVFRITKILFIKVPLKFGEAMARHLTHEEAPELWTAVENAAAELGTPPPDHIVVGMQMNFYVTELAVVHSMGKTQGKTLFLSYPLLKQMPLDEVMAIIGHELGHFIGEDTVMSRSFYPKRLKFNAVFQTLAHSGLSGRPAFHLMHLFHLGFSQVFGEHSRAREFLADTIGAKITSPRTQATALVRLHVVLEVFDRMLTHLPVAETVRLFDRPCFSYVSASIQPNDDLWQKLFTKIQPHPLDSHPPLQARLESLKVEITSHEARELAEENFSPAYANFFPVETTLFNELLAEAEVAITRLKSQISVTAADVTTPEGRVLLKQNFPSKTWSWNPKAYRYARNAIVTLLTLPLIAAIFVPYAASKVIFLLVSLICAIVLVRHRILNHNALLTVDSEGLTFSGWKNPLPFSAIYSMGTTRKDAAYSLHFRLQPGIASPVKFRLVPFRLPFLSLNVSRLDDSPLSIAEKIFSYYTRQNPMPTSEYEKSSSPNISSLNTSQQIQ